MTPYTELPCALVRLKSSGDVFACPRLPRSLILLPVVEGRTLPSYSPEHQIISLSADRHVGVELDVEHLLRRAASTANTANRTFQVDPRWHFSARNIPVYSKGEFLIYRLAVVQGRCNFRDEVCCFQVIAANLGHACCIRLMSTIEAIASRVLFALLSWLGWNCGKLILLSDIWWALLLFVK